jgi:hypothetical protein
MRTIQLFTGVVSLFLAIGSQGVKANPPSTAVTFQIREVPTDLNSAVLFTVTLAIDAVSVDQDAVGWSISQATFQETGAGRIWARSDPPIDTVDGLWWVKHADVENPVTAEFRYPPTLQGIAPPVSGTTDSLDYAFAGTKTEATGSTSNLAMVTYAFQNHSTGEPIITPPPDEEEPVEITREEDA